MKLGWSVPIRTDLFSLSPVSQPDRPEAAQGKGGKRMGKKDTRTKRYMSDPEHFADAFNSSVFGGKQVVKAESLSLQDMDPTESGIVITEDAGDIVQKVRDVLKKSVVMEDGQTAFLILGIENQSEVHYAMPVRNLIYDALNYGQQVNRIAAQHKKDKDVKTGREYLSGFKRTDKLMPVITLTIYFGAKEWDAPRCLKDMFPKELRPEILDEVDDYRLHLIIPSEIRDFSVFKTELGTVMKFIAASEDGKKLKELCKDAAFEQVSAETVQLINECIGSEIEVPKGEEVIDMCKGWKEYGQEMREEGVFSTLEELVRKGLLTVQIAAEQAGMSTEEFEKKIHIGKK